MNFLPIEYKHPKNIDFNEVINEYLFKNVPEPSKRMCYYTVLSTGM